MPVRYINSSVLSSPRDEAVAPTEFELIFRTDDFTEHTAPPAVLRAYYCISLANDTKSDAISYRISF
jgi:hypothetical protein